MAGQATVTIGDKTWTVSLATTPQEWARGLAGLASLPAGTGLLFDLGADLVAPVTTAEMLFPLDILWIGSSLQVVALARDIAPGNHITPQAAARYVLEVNAGETPGIEAGVPVALQEFPTVAAAFNIGDIVTPLTQVMVLMLAFRMLRSFMRALLATPRRCALPSLGRPAGVGLLMARTEGGNKVYFIGGCKVVEGCCLSHSHPATEAVRCPQSPLTQEEWEAAFELAREAFPAGQANPWVDGWWPASREEAERTIAKYERGLRDAFVKYRGRMQAAIVKYRAKAEEAIELYRHSVDKAVAHYREHVMREYEKGRERARVPVSPHLIGPGEKRETPAELEFFADSAEQCCASLDGTGLHLRLEQTFQEAIARARTGG